MNTTNLIRQSEYWQAALVAGDPHFAPGSGVTLADHLEAVAANAKAILIGDTDSEWVAAVRACLDSHVMPCRQAFELIGPSALLHDLGKLFQEGLLPAEHPLSGQKNTNRHSIISAELAARIIPPDLPGRDLILALVEQHDQPYSWYCQQRAGHRVPSPNAWRRLGERVWPGSPERGIAMLCVLKCADSHGHDDIDDAVWFCSAANENLFNKANVRFPVPSPTDLRALASAK